MFFSSDSRDILIIHFGLKLQESILDSNGHDLWKTYKVISLIWIKLNSLYFNVYIYILDSDWCMVVFDCTPPSQWCKTQHELMEQNVINCEGDQKKLFSLIQSLFGSKKITVLPEYTSSFTLASSITMFLLRKFIISKLNFLFWKRVYQCIRLLI